MSKIEIFYFFNRMEKKWKKSAEFVEAVHTKPRFVRHPGFREDLVYFDYMPKIPVGAIRYNKGTVDFHEILPFLQDEAIENIRKAYAEMHRDVNAKE